eukprot:4513838-Pyramimonas_sp.AAC.1
MSKDIGVAAATCKRGALCCSILGGSRAPEKAIVETACPVRACLGVVGPCRTMSSGSSEMPMPRTRGARLSP